jgi:hypothetical protein
MISIPHFNNAKIKTILAQYISSELRLPPISTLPQDTIAAFFKVPQPLISRAKAVTAALPSPDSVSDVGRPS